MARLSQRLSRRNSVTAKSLQMGSFSRRCQNLPNPCAPVRLRPGALPISAMERLFAAMFCHGRLRARRATADVGSDIRRTVAPTVAQHLARFGDRGTNAGDSTSQARARPTLLHQRPRRFETRRFDFLRFWAVPHLKQITDTSSLRDTRIHS